MHRGGSQPHLSPNGDRANVKNPDNQAYEADKTHRGRQKSGGG